MPPNLLHRTWPVCLLLWATVAAAVPVLAPAEEDYGVFQGDPPLALQEPDARAPAEMRSVRRLADGRWRDSDLGLADQLPQTEVLIDLPETASMRKASTPSVRDDAPFLRRSLEPLTALPERPIEPMLTAAMQRIDSPLENRDLRPTDDRVDLRWLLPGEWLNFVRENRPWVLGGAAGLLLLFWVGSALIARRPH
jgi:hypothetical protein